MRYLKACLLVAIAAVAIAHAQARAATPQADSGLGAYRTVCAAEATKLITEIKLEIEASQQPKWTAADERKRIDNEYTEVLSVTAEQLRDFHKNYPEIWKESTPFIQRPSLLLAACAITVVNNWNAGVRDVPGLNQKWAAARASYAAGVAPAGAASSTTPAGTRIQTSPSQSPSAPTETPRPSPSADAPAGTSSNPVDCVQIESPGRFRNDCDFDVYFSYCGIDPEEGSFVGACAKQAFGLLDIKARGFQAGFTRAKRLYFFECRSPHTPKELEYKGEKLYGYCK